MTSRGITTCSDSSIIWVGGLRANVGLIPALAKALEKASSEEQTSPAAGEVTLRLPPVRSAGDTADYDRDGELMFACIDTRPAFDACEKCARSVGHRGLSDRASGK
jgi:hypothetical protein